MPSFDFSTFSVFAHRESKNLKFWWWLMIVIFSKRNFGLSFDPFSDGIFEKFQRIWQALWKYFRALAGQNSRFRPRKGSFWKSKLKKKIFDEKLAAGWSRGFPLEGKPMTFSKDSQFKTLFLHGSPVKKFQSQRQREQKSCAGGELHPHPVLLGLKYSLSGLGLYHFEKSVTQIAPFKRVSTISHPIWFR